MSTPETKCEHILRIDGDYRILQCASCHKLLIFKVLKRDEKGEIQTTKLLGTVEEKSLVYP